MLNPVVQTTYGAFVYGEWVSNYVADHGGGGLASLRETGTRSARRRKRTVHDPAAHAAKRRGIRVRRSVASGGGRTIRPIWEPMR